MKIVISSDWHLDAVTSGIPRFDEVARAVQQTVEAAKRERADLYLFLGDLCDPDASRAPRCVAYAIQVAAELARAGIPSRWLVGNHDVIEDGSATSTLSPLAAASHSIPMAVPMSLSPKTDRPVLVYERPMWESLCGIRLLALPFVPRAAAYDPWDFIDPWQEETPDLIIGHLNVPGVIPGSESDEYARGRDSWFPVEKIRQRWPKVVLLNGHYHSPSIAPGDVLIPGSLARLTHGEAHNDPGYLLVEVG